jgi:hypothetical protein
MAGGRVTFLSDRGINDAFSKRMNSIGGTSKHVKWKPYSLFDVFVSDKVYDQFQIEAATDNVTGAYYTDTLTFGLMLSPGSIFRPNTATKFKCAGDHPV